MFNGRLDHYNEGFELWEVILDSGIMVYCSASSKLHNLHSGDRVRIEPNPYKPSTGRVVARINKPPESEASAVKR